MPSASIQQVTDATFAEKVQRALCRVLVGFWSPSSVPSQAQESVLLEFAKAHPDVSVVMVDVDANPTLRDTHGIFSVPTLAVFEDGRLIGGAIGAQGMAGLEHLIQLPPRTEPRKTHDDASPFDV